VIYLYSLLLAAHSKAAVFDIFTRNESSLFSHGEMLRGTRRMPGRRCSCWPYASEKAPIYYHNREIANTVAALQVEVHFSLR
jgi:hypothetical protein